MYLGRHLLIRVYVNGEGQFEFIEQSIVGRNGVHGAAKHRGLRTELAHVPGEYNGRRLQRGGWHDVAALEEVHGYQLRVSLQENGRMGHNTQCTPTRHAQTSTAGFDCIIKHCVSGF